MILKKEDILNAVDLDTKDVDVPKWGKVKIKSMSIAEQIEFGKINSDENEKNIALELIVMCVIDDEGNKLFSRDDIPLLSKKSSVPIMHLFEECCKLNAMGGETLEQKAKNS